MDGVEGRGEGEGEGAIQFDGAPATPMGICVNALAACMDAVGDSEEQELVGAMNGGF